jgi:hypothetical protein
MGGLDWPPVPDKPRDITPPRRALTGSGGRLRFALPTDHHEEEASDRTSERIEAFLDGPTHVTRARRRSRRLDGAWRPRPTIPLESGEAWTEALRREDLRVTRYGRAASVLIVEISAPGGRVGDEVAAGVGGAVRAQTRETDHVTRIGPCRFHVLLPETDERDAMTLAERVARTCRQRLSTSPEPRTLVHASVATARGGGTLVMALDLAEARLAAMKLD